MGLRFKIVFSVLCAVGLSGCMQDTISVTAIPAPTASLTSMPAQVKGAQTFDVLFDAQAQGGKTVSSIDFEYAADGTTFSSVEMLDGSATHYQWAIPKVDNAGSKIKIIVKDNRGMTTEQVSSTFAILSTAPQIKVTTSNQILSKDDSATFSGTCKAGAKILYYGGMVPTSSSATLAHYNAVTAPICTSTGTWSLTIGEKTLNQIFSYTLAQSDAVGNSTSASFTWTRSTVGPTILANSMNLNDCALGAACNTSLHNTKLSIKATAAFTNVQYACFKWTLTGTPAVAPKAFATGASNDTCWNTVETWSGGATAAAQSITFDHINYPIGFFLGTYQVFAWFQDSIGNVSTLSNSGKGTAGTDLSSIYYTPAHPPTVDNIVVAGTDQPAYPITPAQMTVASGASIYVKWAIADGNNDTSGNALPVPAQSISLYYTTDEVNYTLIASGLNNAVNGSCTTAYNKTGTNLPNETGCYLWKTASPTSSYLKIRVVVKNTKDMTAYASSAALNTGSMHWLAGNTDLGLGGSASAAVFINKDNGHDPGDHHTLAVANDGTVYFRDDLRGVLKIDPISGVVSTYLPKSTNGKYSGDGVISSVSLMGAQMINLDYQDNLLVWDAGRILKVNTSANPATVTTIIGGGTTAVDGNAATAVTATSVLVLAPSTSDGHLFQPLPNGDIMFQSSSGTDSFSGTPFVRHYHATGTLAGKVTTTYLTGVGTTANPTRDFKNDPCSTGNNNIDYIHSYAVLFDAATSAITTLNGMALSHVNNISNGCPAGVNFDPTTGIDVGAGPHLPWPTNNDVYTDASRFNARNGDLYSVSRLDSVMSKYDPTTNTWKAILGGAGRGHCDDGALAIGCKVQLMDAYVNTSNQVFFTDAGTIRVINQDGTVFTLFGQSKAYGDTGLALTARFNSMDWIDVTDVSGKVVIADYEENKLRAFIPGALIDTIAGNTVVGTAITSSVAKTSQLEMMNWNPESMLAVPGTDDVIVGQNGVGSILRLKASDGTWTRFGSATSSGGTAWTQADGYPATSVKFPTRRIYPLGFSTDANSSVHNLLMGGIDTNGTDEVNSMLKTYDFLGTGIQSGLAGVIGLTSTGTNLTFASDSSSVATSPVPNPYRLVRSNWDPIGQRWMMAVNATNRIVNLKSGGSMTSYTLPHVMLSFTYLPSTTSTAANPQGTIYYCGNGSTLGSAIYTLRKYDTATAADTELAWPSATVQCTGRSLIWDASRKSLVFPLAQNGLEGIGEVLP